MAPDFIEAFHISLRLYLQNLWTISEKYFINGNIIQNLTLIDVNANMFRAPAKVVLCGSEKSERS